MLLMGALYNGGRCIMGGTVMSRLVVLGRAPFYSLILLFILSAFICSDVSAGDPTFNPRKYIDSLGKPEADHVEHKLELYSFDRYEPKFRGICTKMEQDGRADKLAALAEVAMKQEQDGPSCKAFWRMIFDACRKIKSKQVTTKKQEEPLTEAPVLRQRYPAIDVIDATSALSSLMYADQPGLTPTLKTLKIVTDKLLSNPSLSTAERDYYTIFTTYLLAAWQGREVAVDPQEGSD